MTDTTAQFPNVRAARHATKAGLTKVLVAADHIGSHLSGRTGMTKEQQVENLNVSLQHFEALETAVAEAKAALTETIALAEQRDFEAHQEAKAAARAEGFADVATKEAVESMASEAEQFANSGDLAAPKGEASDADSKEPVSEVADTEE